MADSETTFVKGRGKKTALILLTAASQLEHDKYVVRAQRDGYVVPVDVAARYEELLTELDAAVADEETKQSEPEPELEKTPAVKKTAAKKTTAKRAAAKPKEN